MSIVPSCHLPQLDKWQVVFFQSCQCLRLYDLFIARLFIGHTYLAAAVGSGRKWRRNDLFIAHLFTSHCNLTNYRAATAGSDRMWWRHDLFIARLFISHTYRVAAVGSGRMWWRSDLFIARLFTSHTLRCFIHRWSAPVHQNVLIRTFWCTGALHRWIKQRRDSKRASCKVLSLLLH